MLDTPGWNKDRNKILRECVSMEWTFYGNMGENRSAELDGNGWERNEVFWDGWG